MEIKKSDLRILRDAIGLGISIKELTVCVDGGDRGDKKHLRDLNKAYDLVDGYLK